MKRLLQKILRLFKKPERPKIETPSNAKDWETYYKTRRNTKAKVCAWCIHAKVKSCANKEYYYCGLVSSSIAIYPACRCEHFSCSERNVQLYKLMRKVNKRDME